MSNLPEPLGPLLGEQDTGERYIVDVIDVSTGERLVETDPVKEIEADDFYEFADELARAMGTGRRLRITMRHAGEHNLGVPIRTHEVILGAMVASASR